MEGGGGRVREEEGGGGRGREEEGEGEIKHVWHNKLILLYRASVSGLSLKTTGQHSIVYRKQQQHNLAEYTTPNLVSTT